MPTSNQMDLSVVTEEHGPLLYVRVSGAVRVGRGERLYESLLEQCVRSGRQVILIDCRGLAKSPSDVVRYAFATHVARLHADLIGRGGRAPRIAVVAEAPIFNPARMLENAAVNRGVELRSLTSVIEAIRWLGLDPEAESLRTLA
jgi:hypothetical protein